MSRLLPLLFFTSFLLANAQERPNVILLLVDDLGWKDIGCQGSTYYQTPNIDKLAADGVRYTNAYAACAVCSPTRAAILTGKYPARLLLTQWLPAGRWSPKKHKMREGRFLRSLPLEETTLAEALRAEGYTTWHIGKWHLGGEPFSMPRHHGFDINIGGDDHGAPGSFFYPFKGSWRIPTTNLPVHKQAWTGGKDGDYLTDCLTDEAIKLLNKNDQPFFLYFPYYAVHTPLQGKPELVEKYQSIPKANSQGNPAYAAMVEAVDQSVGRIVKTLENNGQKDNTVIIFTSDNGGFAKATDNSPLRANKGSHYEGGIRVPLIISGPNLDIPPGSIINTPAISCDLYPTILELTKSVVPLSDGQNLLTETTESDRPLFWHYPHYNRHPQNAPVSIIRRGKWKLIEFLESGNLELYNLETDPGEANDLSKSKKSQANELLQQLHQWKTDIGADPMQPNPQYTEK